MLAIEIIQNIKNIKAAGIPTDDTGISDFQWMFIIDYYRAQLIRNAITKGHSINQQSIQELNPNKITLTQSTIEKCEMYTNGLPKAIETQNSILYTFIGTEKGKSYQRTTYNKSQWDGYSKYIGLLPKWYALGNKITVVNHSKSLKLNVKGLFERPIDVVTFNGELDEMNPFNFEYPCSNTMLDSILKMIADSEMKISMLIPSDNLNDGKDGQ